MVVGDCAPFIHESKNRVLESDLVLTLLDRRRQKNQTTRNMPITATPRITPMTAPNHVGIPELEGPGARPGEGVDVALARK